MTHSEMVPSEAADSGMTLTVGATVEAEVGPVAHGGHCVARVDGRVVFVRHSLPGERVRVRITEQAKNFWRGDAVEILAASGDRVTAPCEYAAECGGCDFQHVSVPGQLRLLASVVEEQLRRLAGIDRRVEVEEVTPTTQWRTRVRWAVAPNGLAGLRRHRSHEVLPIERCVIADPGQPEVAAKVWDVDEVFTRVTSTGEQVLVAGTSQRVGGPVVHEEVHGVSLAVDAQGFWQVHPASAHTLVDAVVSLAGLQPGDRVLDLYGGVGLFARFLAGEGRDVLSIEGDRRASKLAESNLAGVASALHGDVVASLRRGLAGQRADVVVLDPPRAGAKPAVASIAALEPRRIVYVACDPAAMARDIASFGARGYELADLRAFALFPMTHHVECVALLTRA